jgi:hypothetical protein
MALPSSFMVAGKQHGAYEGRVDQDRRGEPDGELLHVLLVLSPKQAGTATIVAAAIVTRRAVDLVACATASSVRSPRGVLYLRAGKAAHGPQGPRCRLRRRPRPRGHRGAASGLTAFAALFA